MNPTHVPQLFTLIILFCRALEDQFIWETRSKQAKDLMSEMLKSRMEMQELSRQYDIRPLNKPQYTDAASAALDAAKLVRAPHYLKHCSSLIHLDLDMNKCLVSVRALAILFEWVVAG